MAAAGGDTMKRLLHRTRPGHLVLLRLQQTRGATREGRTRAGAKFAPQSYHDFIIAQGLLPPNLLEKAVMDGYVKSR
jgi:hypothetical protein